MNGGNTFFQARVELGVYQSRKNALARIPMIEVVASEYGFFFKRFNNEISVRQPTKGFTSYWRI